MFENKLRRVKKTYLSLLVMGTFLASLLNVSLARAEVVKIGLNYPKTGPYSVQGLDQWRATELAVSEINAAGGINGKKLELIIEDTQGKPDIGRSAIHREILLKTDRFNEEERDLFWGRIDQGRPDVCWPWIGATTGSNGYGVLMRRKRSLRAHRLAYVLVHGPITPVNQVVRHSCDNPPCCNPAHLILGTQLDNAADREARGSQ